MLYSINRRKYFTLIEIAISITLILTIVLFMMSVFSQGYRYMHKTKMHAIACFLVQEKLEDLSSGSAHPELFTTPNPGVPCPPNCKVVPPDEIRSSVSGFSSFDREVEVTCPYLGFNNLAKVEVTVFWQGESGERSFKVDTLIANFQ